MADQPAGSAGPTNEGRDDRRDSRDNRGGNRRDGGGREAAATKQDRHSGKPMKPQLL